MAKSIEKNPVLRQHQVDALKAIRKVLRKGEGKGRIVLPTGTGKTRCESEVLCEIIGSDDPLVWPGVYVVLSPRILLAYQQLDEFLKCISCKGIESAYTVVNSGGLNSAEYEKKLLKYGFDDVNEIVSTTSPEQIAAEILSAKKKNVPIVIFSTYHSVDRVDTAATKAGIKIKCYVYDEAQYCVSTGDFQLAPTYDSNFKFFFTATEKMTDDDNGLGMNNESKFGKPIFSETPITLIKRGEMASVALHLVGTRGQDIADDDYESMAKVVIEAFDKHRSVMKEHSFLPEMIGPKMVVVCDKQDSLKGIMWSKAMKEYRADNPTINLCGLSSNFGIEVNGVRDPRVNNRNKEVLLAKMKAWKPEEEAIVLHVDMIAEGLDVPGITAVMPFRSLGKIKFLQNVGRGTRLVDIDRAGLYAGRVEPMDFKHYVKPYCWLVLPVLSETYYDTKRRYTDYIQALRHDYGFDPSELIVIDNIVAPPEVEPAEDLVGNVKRKFSTGKGLIEEIIHSIEDGEAMSEFMEHSFAFNTLSSKKQIELLEEIYA
jgi:hypothetical protein